MKKFNSIFAIAAIALTSVFGFTSCDKNDDAFSQPEQKVERKQVVVVNDSYICIPVVEGQTEYIDATYNLTVDGKSVQIKVDDMTETKDAKLLSAANNGKEIGESFKDTDGNVNDNKIAIYVYNLGKVANVKLNSIVYSSKGKLVDKEHEIDFLTGCKVIRNYFCDEKEDYRYFKGINELNGFFDILNEGYRNL